MTKQLELFEPLKNLTGEEAWTLAKAVSAGKYSYEDAKEMVASVDQLDGDLRYIDDICNQYSY